MAYKPIYDGEFDVAIDPKDGGELSDLLESIFGRKIVMLDYRSAGPAGHPTVKLRGTMNQLLSWIRDYLFEGTDELIGTNNGAPWSDIEAWGKYCEELNLECVA